MHKRLIGYLFLGLFLCTGSVRAETVYVHDYLRLGVRTLPNSSEPAIAVVTTGDALSVLERREGYLKVRTGEGTEGWVSESYVSAEKPVRMQLVQLKKESERREAELKALQKALADSEGKNKTDKARLAKLLSDNAVLEQQVSRYTSRNAELQRKYAWAYQAGAALALLLFGFYFGVRWYKRRITDRLGGLEI